MNLAELTKQNQEALPIYKEAVAILALPRAARRARIDAHPQPERLAAEVARIHAWRKDHPADQGETGA